MFIGDVFDPFAQVKKYMKVKDKPISIDNWIHGLHRKPTFIVGLISLMFILSYPAILENPISCFGPKVEEVPKDFLDEWCWLSGTYIVPEHIGKCVGKEVVMSGVGPDIEGTTRLYQNHYIYYPIVFLLIVASFKASKEAWFYLEGGKLKTLLSEMSSGIGETEILKRRIALVTDHLTAAPEQFNITYSCRYIFCEVLNALNIILQFWALNVLLHEEYITYGFDAFRYLLANPSSSCGQPNPEISDIPVDPFTRLFPKMTLCHFIRSGPSGNSIPFEALCVLPLNNLADKLFLFWWVWLIILGFFTFAGLAYRLLVLCSGCARYAVLRFKTSVCSSKDLRYVVDNFTYGDWFILSLMQKNMDCMLFAEFIQELVIKKRETLGKQQ